MSAEAVDRIVPWWEQHKVDLPAGTRGNVEVRQFTVAPRHQLRERLAMLREGRGVPEGTYTGIYRNGRLWMSDTPDEIGDHLGVITEIRRRGGRVLINGLGLGMIVKAAMDAVPDAAS